MSRLISISGFLKSLLRRHESSFNFRFGAQFTIGRSTPRVGKTVGVATVPDCLLAVVISAKTDFTRKKMFPSM